MYSVYPGVCWCVRAEVQVVHVRFMSYPPCLLKSHFVFFVSDNNSFIKLFLMEFFFCLFFFLFVFFYVCLTNSFKKNFF